jgi:hypothetical protein
MENLGVLKVDVTVHGITYKKGERASFPVQYGLAECFEDHKEIKTPIDGKEKK